ncbi:MAG: sugar transferase [Lachnospiraceae bacterium]|jgi:undecaprenyl-phosphate galactose phosphotransferase|nr:sugar transferase [Lachnospiraceae bacterium]
MKTTEMPVSYIDLGVAVDTYKSKKQVKSLIKRVIYRFVDILASIVGLVVLAPMTAVVSFINFVNKENGSLFFVQERIGKDGKTFKMYKYRTMVMNAEEILKNWIENNEELGEEYIANKKIKDDPRITKIGKILRKTSLDEFPQFINILKGEMTLVGPRPYLPMEKEDMGEDYNDIVKMKPGLTGPWQVAGRNNMEFEDRVKLDSEYGKNNSIKTDVKIVLQTVVKVIKREGAL